MKGRFALQVRRYGRSFLVLIAVAIVGTAAGFYILLQQRLPNPFQALYHIDASFPTVAAVAPGLGEPVNVAGVRVGQITGVDIKDGQGIVHMAIDPGKLPRKDLSNSTHADLVPNTPLKDMQVNVFPGSVAKTGQLPDGTTIPISQTTSPTDADDLLQSLDTDTRQWFTSLISDLNQATTGRGPDIRKLLSTLGPTSKQLRQIGDLLAARRHELAAVVHNLGVLTKATSQKDTQLRQVIQSGNTTVQALASQDVALQAAIRRLPGTLAATRSTLADLTPFANALGPTATALIPTAQRLPQTLRDTQTLFEGAALLPLKEIPPFVRAVVPLAKQVGPVTTGLRQVIPSLTTSFKVLNYVTNELGYNPGGRNPGFLYWLAWFAHNLDSFISTGDANGPVWRGLAIVNCAGLKGAAVEPLLTALFGTTFGC
jgi:phospholipid/cholesterol/gamma-HCH transport system substrate-binding protein